MILWFGNKKKKEELKAAGLELEAENAAERDTAASEQEAEKAAESEAAEQAEIERKVAEANVAWEERQKRERAAAEAEANRLAKAAQRAEADRLDAARKATAARQAAEQDEAASAALAEAEAEAARLAVEAESAAAAKAEKEAVQAKADEELRRLDERREARAIREAAEAAARERALEEANDPGFVSKLGQGLSRSSTKLASGLAIFNKKKIDDEMLEDLEDLLITSDLGASVAARVTKNLAKERFDKEVTAEEIRLALADEIEAVLKPHEQIVDFSDGPRPRVVLFVGVNGSGKTTTIGKIASKLTEQGAKALLVAGDTFRAAAIEQLTVWGERAGIPVMSKPTGADAAGLVYEAIERAKEEDLDLVLVDTAGRLQNKAELMAELEKVVRVVKKIDPLAPHDVILVLDATVGQNALSQVEAFKNTAGVTGLVMTKLDGTAKGGVLVAIAEAHDLPIHFIGVGEGADDLKPFSAKGFARALVGVEDSAIEN